MQTIKTRWDVERAAAWLRRHGWGDTGEEAAPPLCEQVVAEAQAEADADAGARAEDGSLTEEDIDIACWPALGAPFYD